MRDINEKKHQACLFFWLLLILLLVPASSVLGIRLIDANLLFEITDRLNQPSDVAVSNDGRIHVVDGVNGKIKIFNQKGKPMASFGRQGTADGEFRNPLGIDVDDSGRIYIADAGNHRVQIFDAEGNFVNQIKITSKKEHPPDPTDVAVDETRNRCFIVDNDNHAILAYDLSSLQLIAVYGTPGAEKLQFRYPFLIAMDSKKYLYIVDVINTRVQILNPDGLFVNFIGGWGVEKGEFYRPKGVALDKNNRIYVSDSWMGVIQVFEPTGEFYAALGDRSQRRVKRFKTPVGLFIDRRNRIYVVEMFANKVSVYDLGDVFTANSE
jgi:tripartite motif-containing protein 71